MVKLAFLCAALVLPLAAYGADAFREEFDSVADWEARPYWLGAPADHPVARSENGVGTFAIAEPGRGMKWVRSLRDVDVDLCPWLVIRYRAINLAAEAMDYLLWLGDADRRRDGVRLIRGEAIRADGAWHTQVFDLAEAGVASPLHAMALQCLASVAGNASLEVDYIAITDTPPADGERYAPAGLDDRSWTVEMTDPAAWTVEPSWLGNYSERSRCEGTPEGTRFVVPEAGMGAKWSRTLPQAIVGPAWVAMRYRARGVNRGAASTDYALYVAAEPGGRALQEQYLIHLGDLVGDGAWHVEVSRVTIPAVKTLAVQVQAATEAASLEIASLSFHTRKPPVRLADVFACEVGWPADREHMHPLILPEGNVSGEDLARRLGYPDWISAGRITVAGVPFELRQGPRAVGMTPREEPGSIEVPLEGRGAELYLLLGAQLPSTEEPSFGGGKLNVIRQVERFVAKIEYADGTTEKQFPLQLASREHAIGRGLHAYSLALEPDRDLERLVLRDGMARGAFALVAATVSDQPGPASKVTAVRPAVALPGPRPVGTRAAGITRLNDRIILDAWTVSMTLDCSHGLRMAHLENHSWAGAPLSFSPGPLFRVLMADGALTSCDFVVTQVAEEVGEEGRSVRVDLRCEKVNPPVSVSVMAEVTTPPEIGLRAWCDFGGRDPATVRFVFPELAGLGFGGDSADDWYWMPRRGSVVSNVGASLREMYAGGGNPMQIMGVFDPHQGTGLYMMTQDLEAVPRFYQLQKDSQGLRLAVEYTPTGGGQTPRTVVGCNQGDWHPQLERYREWVSGWYKPAAPRKAWFRHVFNFRQQFLHFELPTRSGMFDPQTKTLRLKEVLEEDAAAFGGVDYLHLFDWGWDPVHGRCGDYVPWEYLGGADNFSRAVQEVMKAGVPVGLYIEGYLVDPESELGKAHGADWQLLDAHGKPYTYFAPSFNICSWVKDWQDYLSAVYARVRRETGAVGFYIDEYGFSGPGHLCYNPGHGHPIPVTPVLGEREMTRRVREAIGPDCVLYTEESPTDVNSQYQDGSFTYAITTGRDDWSPSRVNLYRFAFPHFKTIEIICCDQPLGSNVEAVKRILFNGEAIWIEGIWDRWFTAETRAAIGRMHAVLRANRECFAGDFPTPLVPTLVEGLYANRFQERADGTGKTCWTLYNTGFRTVRGELLAVEHLPGATYRDELTDRGITVRVEGERAFLGLELGPRDVTVIGRTVPQR